MNRSIKFRVWNVKDGWFFPLDKAPRLKTSGEFDCELGFYDELIVQQFTGLVDKNGRDIYEGDIVKVSEYNPVSEKYEESLEVICWRYCGFVTLHPMNYDQKWCGGNGICDTNNLEVIGNIFENQDLLNK